MNDAGHVRYVQRGRDLEADLLGRIRRESSDAVEAVVQTFALQELHRDERHAIVGGAELVNRHDARMRQLRHGPRLLQEALECLRVRDVMRMEELQRDIAIETRIVRAEDEPERTLAEF